MLKSVPVKGIAHITGGGFIENIPRMFPKGIGCEIETDSYELPALFQKLWKLGELTKEQIYNTFNMGVGMVVCIAQKDVARTIASLEESGERAFVIGKTVAGEGVTLL